MYYSQNIIISALQLQKPSAAEGHSSILRWNLTLRRILRCRRYQKWHRHTTLQHPHWPPCWQTLQRPRTGTAWAGNLLPQPHPSLTQLSVLPGCARALTTNQPPFGRGWREPLCWATLHKTAPFKFLPRSLQTLTAVPPFLRGWGQGEQRMKERFYPLWLWSRYRTEQWVLPVQGAWNKHQEVGKNFISVGINSETPAILVYDILVYYTEKKVSQSYE